MNFFSWGSSENSAPASNDPPAGNPPVDAIAAARSKVTENVQTRKRGRPAADAGSIERDNALVRSEIERQLEQCYDPKAWGALLGLPADAAHALTARDHWKLSRDERDTLGATGSAAARTMMITNPRGLAFLMLGSALISIYLPRAMREIEHMRKEKANDAEKNRKPSA